MSMKIIKKKDRESRMTDAVVVSAAVGILTATDGLLDANETKWRKTSIFERYCSLSSLRDG